MSPYRHVNPMGGVHGGFAAAVLDSVTGCAVHTMLDPGFGCGTVDLNIKMLRLQTFVAPDLRSRSPANFV